MQPSRDARIDVLKGLALLCVLIDHVEDACGVAVLSRWTLRAWGPSDAAELFVLVSGLVAGRSCKSRLGREGFWRTQRRSLERAVMVYASYCATAFLLLWTMAIGESGGRVFPPGPSEPQAGVFDAWMQAAALHRAPLALHILVLYLTLIPLSPAVVWMGRRSRLAALALSLTVYVASQRGAAAGATFHSASLWYFHPGGWQLLYVFGLLAGMQWMSIERSSGLGMTAAMRCSTWLLAAVVIAAGWFVRPEVQAHLEAWPADWPLSLRNTLVHLSSKPRLGPVRAIHALAVVWSIWSLLPRTWRRTPPPWLHAVSRCGRYSLWAYCTGVVLSFGGVQLIATTAHPWAVLLIEVDLMLALMGLAWMRSRLQTLVRGTR